MHNHFENDTEANSSGHGPNPLISIVLPVYNEFPALKELATTLHQVFEHLPYDYEILFINDGSTDGSEQEIDSLTHISTDIRAVHLSRNFGHQAALHAGLTAARGDAVIVMDSDLQDAPQGIPGMISQWEAGYEVVYAIRTQRKEFALKRLMFFCFYRILRMIAAFDIPSDAGNFGLIDRRVANHIIQLPEVSRFYPGLRSWTGFRQTGIPVERAERHDDTPRVTFTGLVRLARTALFSFSATPLTLFYAVAMVSCLVCFSLTTFTLYQKVAGDASPGWASGLITASFFGMLNALGIAVLGEYVVRIFDQVRARPQYIIDRTVNMYPDRPHSKPPADSEGLPSASPSEPQKHQISHIPADH